MGKQVQFYMTHEDEKNFLASISDLAPVRLIYKAFTEPLHLELESFEPVGGHKDDAHLCLVNATLGTVPKVNSSSQHSYRFVDPAESEVVEFLRCQQSKGQYKPSHTWLSSGRLWFTEQTMDGRKSDAFVKWANSLLKWVRKKYERDARGNYAAPNAHELFKAGKLQLGPSDEPELSLEERKRILGVK
jgi:hypothetical protein